MIWLLIALMTAAIVLCLVWPLASARAARSGPEADIAFYAGLVREVDEEIARGAVAPGEAAAARAEVGRRLLAVARAPGRIAEAGGFRTRRLVAVGAATLLVPVVALGLYLRVGQPAQPDMPLASRSTSADDIMGDIARIEAHLATHPEDGRGFEVLAPVYLRMGRADDAAKAWRAAIRALGDTAARENALGNALTMGADGVVGADARAAFAEALKLDPASPQARFMLALAAEQDGDKVEAEQGFRALLADSPADAPWRDSVQQHIAALTGQPPPAPAGVPAGPTAAAVAALPAGAQRQAIQGMVDGLAARLATDGRDVDGWLRLLKAYTVLGENDRARAALGDARRALATDAAALARLNAGAHDLGLDG